MFNLCMVSELKFSKCITEWESNSFGHAIYKSITDDVFKPEEFLESVDLSAEYKILDLKNRIEASAIIWMRKMHNKDSKSSWGSADVGQSILESYSRVFESLSFTVISQIDDVLYADSVAQDPSNQNSTRRRSLTDSEMRPVKKLDPKEEMEKLNEALNSMTIRFHGLAF
ncbi:hypothetical protein ZIOFF_056792 [Zingiber officinale]|uniref:PRONE domain-containing protein n=1 Tax=Zingiber officinale TaxID=94328 RepID=A0A8J5FGQ7_ZINOF|nr:hypothetical protein ZIOFF_056792 [Zingiber officinale]